MKVNQERFEELVIEAVDGLPEEFLDTLENVDVVVEDSPNRKQLARAGRGMTLLGLYEGVPHTGRTRGYNMVLPDRITIFQKPIEAICRSEKEVVAQVQRVVQHEIAHHFGLDDDLLRRIESNKIRRKSPRRRL
jgi:predicted Zn-dependent protease with MMP-like domain